MAEIAFLIIQHLRAEAENSADEDRIESLDVAVQCLESTYNVDATSEENKAKYGVEGHTLESLITEGKRAIKLEGASSEISEDDKKKAEEFKNEGNDALKAGNYKGAVESYSLAIKHNPNSPVYYVNRAAAYTKLEEFEMAIEDCESGIQRDNEYSKAYSRMGTCYYMQDMFEEARDAYRKALDLEPNNAAYAQNVRMSENKIPKDEPAAGARGGGMGGMPGGMPDLSGLLGGLGGGAGGLDIGAMLNNPDIMNMARQFAEGGGMNEMMNNPQMAAFAAQMGGAQDVNQNPNARIDDVTEDDSSGIQEMD